MSQGWISIHRKIQEHAIWDSSEPFDKRSAWIDLILLANHEDRKILHGLKVEEVKRGSKITSLRKLSTRWKWSINKVKRFLELLQELDMISYKSDSKKTTYTIVKYNVYQNEDISKRNTNGTPTENKRESNENQTETNNNDNNANNDNKDIVEQNFYKEVIDYLNEKASKGFKASTRKNQELIKARMNEGFNVEDFKKVIDNKVLTWKGDSKMDQYLRPVTLFGTKFESYLNENVAVVAKSKEEIAEKYKDLDDIWTY